MSETRVLLGKIQALRQRLEQAQGLANEARTAAAALVEETAAAGRRLVSFERLVEEGDEHDNHVDRVIRPLTGPAGGDGPLLLPRQLTSRARRVLERGRELLLRLRQLADAFEQSQPDEAVASALFSRHDPLAKLYRETVALTDTALRMIPLFPDTTSANCVYARDWRPSLMWWPHAC